MLARHGYGVLLIDRRGDGRSHGQPNAMGWGNRTDVKAAVDWLHARGTRATSAASGCPSAARSCLRPPALDAVVSEGAGARSLREEMQVDMPTLERPLAALQYGLPRPGGDGLDGPHAAEAALEDSSRAAGVRTLLIAAPNTENGERANRRFKSARCGRSRSPGTSRA